MKTLLLTFAIFLAPLLAPTEVVAQSLAEITKALGSGDSNGLAGMMDAEVELSLLGEENLYSRDEARQKLAAFFAANTPSAFSQVHQGSSKSDNEEYCIGNLTTKSGGYRVYIYIAKKDGKTILQELRFDRE